jgi:uncharacterized RDD family membrane protein YckC
LLGALALAALVTAIMATFFSVGGSDLAGNVQFFAIIATLSFAVLAALVPSIVDLREGRPLTARRKGQLGVAFVAALLLSMLLFLPAALLVVGAALLSPVVARRLARAPAISAEPGATTVASLAAVPAAQEVRTETAPVGPVRMRIARICSVLALVTLAIGSALLATLMTWVWVAWATSDVEDPGLAFAILPLAIWPPTLLLTWVFGVAAFLAKGTLDPALAVIYFVAGFVGSVLVVLPVTALPGGAVVGALALNVAAIQFVRREFWGERPAVVASNVAGERAEVVTEPTATAFAGFQQRFMASLIDWVICYVATYTLLFPVALLVSGDRAWWISALGYIPDAAIPVAYFTKFLARGQSPGMRAVGIRIVSATTGEAPGRTRAFAKAILATAFYPTIVPLASYGFADPGPGGYDTADLAILCSILALFAAGLLARLWIMRNPKKQTLVDKVAGVVVIARRQEEVAP